MKKIVTILFIVAALTGVGLPVSAQVFPIQVNTQLLPPYTPYLSDYTTPGAQKMMAQFRINDPTIAEYRCKLRVTIEGVGITLRTKPNFITQPIVLEGGGIPQLFYGDDLAEYFDPNNMDFSGLSRSEFNKTSRLPEGVYRFSIEVLDYNRGTVVSNKSTTIAWIILNDPPMLNLPRNNTKLRIPDPTYIPFTWTSRHSASPNASFSTEYIFRLVEIWPANRNPYDAFLTQPALFETTVSESQIVYGLTEPALIPGRKYAWQVQARDINRRDLFKNQGRSEVYVFQFGDALGMPGNLRKETANTSTLSLRWEPAIEGEIADQYRIRYKKADAGTWYETVTDQRWLTLSQLQTNTAYDIQVRAEKGKQVGEYTLVKRMSTAEAPLDNGYTCGQPANIPLPDSGTPLFSLAPGDIFTCADFKVVVTEVAKPNGGIFSGKGMVQVNMLNGASVEVSFAGNINSEYKLTTGSVQSLYEAGSAMGQVIDQMQKIGEEKQPEPAQESETDSTTLALGITFLIPGVIDSVYVNEDGKIEVIDEDGNVTTYEQKKDESGEVKETVIADSGGNTYTVDKEGRVTASPTNGATSLINPSTLNSRQQLIYDALVKIKTEVDDSLSASAVNITNKVIEFKNQIRLAGFKVEMYTGANDQFIQPGFSVSVELFNYDEHIGYSLTQQEKNLEKSYAELHELDRTAIKLRQTGSAVNTHLKDNDALIVFALEIKEEITDKTTAYEIVRKNL